MSCVQGADKCHWYAGPTLIGPQWASMFKHWAAPSQAQKQAPILEDLTARTYNIIPWTTESLGFFSLHLLPGWFILSILFTAAVQALGCKLRSCKSLGIQRADNTSTVALKRGLDPVCVEGPEIFHWFVSLICPLEKESLSYRLIFVYTSSYIKLNECVSFSPR